MTPLAAIAWAILVAVLIVLAGFILGGWLRSTHHYQAQLRCPSCGHIIANEYADQCPYCGALL